MSKVLQIRLIKPSSESGGGGGGGGGGVIGGAKPSPSETVTVACPGHLVLADLPVAKGIGPVTTATTIKTVGRRSRRQLGERVHFCVRCDFPIAIYGRLSPCEHAYCLDCARTDSICYLCDERVQKIQTIKMMEGIFICAAPHCLKSFLKRSEFETHIHESHADLLHPNAEKEEGMESEVQSMRQSTPSDSTVRATPRPVTSPGSNPQLLDVEHKARQQQSREPSVPRPMMQPKPTLFGQSQNYHSEPYADIARPIGMDNPGLPNNFQQVPLQAESTQFSDKQRGVLSESSIPEYPPMQAMQPPNFILPMTSNPLMTPQFPVPPFQPEGAQPFYGAAPYDMGTMARPDSVQEIGPEQGSLLGFPPGPAPGANFMPNYPQPWKSGPTPGGPDGFGNLTDYQGNVAFYQQDYGRNPGVQPMIPPHASSGNKVMEVMHSGNRVDLRDGKAILAPQPFSHPAAPPPPPFPHPSQSRRAKYYSDDMDHDAQRFGWQHDNRDSFGSGQD
ncbi:hypothetical protein K2173_000005 [Erythroxylum novogranatense]|uniref:RING-type E3 ubiquitin transferase n=1 Tax=Erythroxylum novogranatense TaxID=1862640 RepID=A0AAV8SP16_9ROSI|nr:hypothetical protein K2173_000005 [Erythroxylum novogranatense]